MVLRNLWTGRHTPAMRRAVLAMSMAVTASPAAAIVRGAPDDGPLKTRTVMVLAEGGGVCSGIVVAPDAVLTAAHCVTGGNAGGKAGSKAIRVHYRDAAGQPVLLEPAGVVAHSGYNAGAIKARERSIDLALIRLAAPLPAPFTPAVLASSGLPPAGSPISAFGWGVEREGAQESMGTFRRAGLVTVEPYGPGKILLWAADPAGLGKRAGAGVCNGDSGGPIAGADGAVVAVSTWAKGSGNDKCGLYTQGVLVAPQRAFIDGTLKRWGRAARWR